MGAKLFGAAVKRLEDPDLLKGNGTYTDDVQFSNTLHAVFVRSPHPHARFTKIETSAAKAMEGVCGVFTLEDFPKDIQDNKLLLLLPNPSIVQPMMPYLLARDEVHFAGEAVACVVAESRYLAEDAAAAIAIDWEVLPSASDAREAVKSGAPLSHSDGKDNISARFVNEYGDVAGAFSGASHRVVVSIRHHRGGGHSLEGRGTLAVYDPDEGRTILWSATQAPHQVKRNIIGVLNWNENEIDVIAPEVGGGFGPKAMFYAEEAVIPFIARQLCRPVKWIEDRREHFLSASQERDQYWDLEAAFDGRGKLLGVRGTMIHDTGAYVPWGIVTPLIASTTVPGPYVLPNFRLETIVALTNKVQVTPVRGAGRPQAVFAMERLMDKAAQEIGLDPAEIRSRNLIPAEKMPYKVGLVFRDGKPVVYDSGDYPRCQSEALQKIGYSQFKDRQKSARQEGRYIGIGIGNYVEGTGLGPFEGATVRVGPSGKIFLMTGAAPQGQGHQTTMAQICAEKFGVDIADIEVHLADTTKIAHGVGTFASRIAANAGPSVHLAAQDVRDKAIKIAAFLLEAAEEDIELEDGKAFVRGVPEINKTLGEISHAVAGSPGFAMPPGFEPGLEATHYFSPEQSAYCNGTHIAEVEVDIETGNVEILRYVIAHDSGNLINPMIVDGQVQGGLAHGIGNALFEEQHFDSDANPLTTNFAEYLIPGAGEVVDAETIHIESPSPLNPLGVKGAGEGGTIPAAASIIAAVENALQPFKANFMNVPLTPASVIQVVEASRKLKAEI
ncbi:MAG: dehydrogenase [Rhodospirillaceae bacterium]|jgi:carbon-monoxide dehydrogenase large subunit|nr:dehydrogenase [Rhodospirillaceae bacterium]